MKLISKLNIVLIISLWMLIGCGVTQSDTLGSEQSPKPTVAGVSVEVLDASSAKYKVLKFNEDKMLQIKLGTEEKDVYILFSNPNNTTNSATVIHNNKIVETENFSKNEFDAKHVDHQHKHGPRSVQDFNNQLFDFKDDKKEDLNLKKVYKTIADIEGKSKEFYINVTSTGTTVEATARKVLTNINTSFGKKSLTIWVEDAAYGNGCSKVKCVNDVMINILANKFLKRVLIMIFMIW